MIMDQSSKKSLKWPVEPLLYHSGTPGPTLPKTTPYLKGLTEPFGKSLWKLQILILSLLTTLTEDLLAG